MQLRAKSVLIVFLILVLGLAAALVSGFYGQNLSKLGLSRVGYGFPLAWHGDSWVVYPGMPIVYWFSLESFLLDAAFWCVMFAFLVLALSKWSGTGA